MDDDRRVSGLWRVLTGSGPVTRSRYLTLAVVLAAAKYAGDAFALAEVLPRAFGPDDYLRGLLLPSDAWPRVGAGSLVFLLLWGAVFLWFAVDLSRRRSIDAGRSPWLGLAVVVPWVNYLVFLALAMLPSADRPPVQEDMTQRDAPPRAMVLAAVVLLALSVVLAYGIGVRRYPASLFVSAPFLMGVVAGWMVNSERSRTPGATAAWACLPLVPLVLFLLLGGLEGLLCIAMALPLTAPLLIIGAMAGRRLAGQRDVRSAVAWAAVLPLVGLTDPSMPPQPREVTTAVVIEAPVEVVWQAVIAFPPITTPPDGIFRLGIAMPLSATLEGDGVGAVRRCRFTTGDFVEPITAWEPGRRLAFDVTDQPVPLRELSWRDVAPPHLEVGFRSVRGEFRLVALPNGRTRLEGSTWYVLDLPPVAYWSLWSDAIVHAVHARVLDHIGVVSETRARERAERPR